ncbi:MAG: calcium-binding protein, partial [Planctomycetes bacterium]|nr:calcium-binding protein [Planctomycetota bacterium]
SATLEWFVDVTAEEATSTSIGLGFESLFGLTNDAKVGNTEDLVGEGVSVPANSSSRLQLGLEFDPVAGNQSQSLQNGFLNSRSRLDRTIYINATKSGGNPVSLQGTSGALGMKLQQGSLVIAQSVPSPNVSAPAVFSSSIPANGSRVRISDLSTYVPQRQTQGQLLADFEVVPDHTGTAERNRLHFETLDFANLAGSTRLLSSPDFPQLRRGVDLQLNLNAFVPAIEDMLKKIESRIIDEVLDRAYPLIGEQLDQFANFIAPFREAINTALKRLNSLTPSTVETAIEDALRNLFNRPTGDFVRIDIKTPTLFKLTLDIEDAPISVTKPANSNLGLPALGADWTADFSVVGAYQFQMTFVLDLKDGFYIETNTETVEMTLDMDMFGQATGKLGFFEIVATADAPAPGKSVFHAEYVIDVTEPSGDNRLFLKEIGTGPLVDTNKSGLSGEAHMSFSIEALVNDWLPSVETGLRIDWEFDGIGFRGHNPPVVTYGGIQLNLGRLLSEVFLPFFETIQDVFEPMQPIIDVITSPLPILSDLMEPDPSILSLATAVKDLMPEDIRRSIESLVEFVETIETIEGIVLAIQRDSGSLLSLQLGSLTFGGTTQPPFDARLDSLDASVLNLASTRGDLRSQFDGANGAPNVSAEFNRSPGALHVPIIENPRNAIGWILGMDQAELITWDLPDASFSFPVGFEFPVLPGILAGIFGGLEIGFDLKVGLDTAGFEAYSRTRDLKDFFQGFYVSDRANADGTGEDINEVFLRGDLLAAAGVGVPGTALLVGGGVFTEVGIDLLDHDRDGKVRGRDFSSGDGCFALRGEFGVALEAQAKVGPLRLELPLAEATLAQGRKVISCPFYEPPPPAVLAGLDSTTGTLTLFMGPEAHRRDVRPNAEEEAFSVKESAGEIVVLAFGKSQSFDATKVRNIVADGGTKDDRISLVGVNKPSILRGGDGDDVINGGEKIDFIDGGAGNDEIFGWGDKDTLLGGNGLDLIHGNDGDDDLFGEEGDDELYGGDGDDEIETGNGRNIAYGDAGNDEIYGGLQRDVIYGGSGNDMIEGHDGPDVLSGDSGIDTIRGQLGDDLIDGGDDGDFLFGNEGDDRLFGRKGIDEIDGGEDADILSGNEDGDFIYGRNGADEIFGDEGDDTIDSGDDPDLIYGGSGSDTIHSGPGDDTVYGGDGADTIDGGDGADTIYGEGLNDTLSGGAGDDTIFGGLGSDTIYGYVRDLLADSLPLGGTDRDKLYGGRGADRISGGPHDDLIYGEEDSDQLVGNEG